MLGAVEAVGAAMLLGVVPGLASLWLGRVFEWTALRVVDALMTLPFTLFAIAAIGVFGNGLNQAMLALGVLLAPLFFRVSRAAALGLKQAQYVEAAELMGASRGRVLRTHIVAKILPTVAVTTAHALATALLTVTSLTFLGVGVQPPAPTWGGVLASDLGYLAQQPWAPVLPGLLIMITVGALNLLADAIRDSGGADAAAGGSGFRAKVAAAAAAGVRAGTRRRKGGPMSRSPSERTTTGPDTEPEPSAPVLAVEGLHITVGAGRTEAVRDVSFTVGAGEAVGVVGESGSGKTLTCRSLLGVLAPGCAVSAGSARLDGTELTTLSARQWERLRGVRLGAVFQDPASYLNPALTVGRQLTEPLRIRLGLGRAEARARAVELFGSVGLRRQRRSSTAIRTSCPAGCSSGC